MSDLFKGFEQLLELAKVLEEKAEKGELKTDIQINARHLSNIPRQGNIPSGIGVSRVRSETDDIGTVSNPTPASSDETMITPPPSGDSGTSAPLNEVGGLSDVLKELRELV